MNNKNENQVPDDNEYLEATVENNAVRVVTLCELGRLVLKEYMDPKFWARLIKDVL